MPISLQKIAGVQLKMSSPQKVKLAGSLDIRHLSCKGPCLTLRFAAVNRVNLAILPDSIVRQNIYKLTENRLSMCENAPTTEGQTCGIARFPHLSEKNYLHTGLL